MTSRWERNTGLRESEAYRVFFRALLPGSVADLVEAASVFFGLPVLLTDQNYKLICQYPPRPIGQAIWDTLYTEKVLPVETIQDYQQTYLNRDGHTYPPFYSKDGPAADCPRIFAEVCAEGRILGHAAVFLFQNPLEEEDLRCVQVFVDALGMLLSPKARGEAPTLSSSLHDLLDEDAAPQVKSLALRSLSGALRGPFAVMATPAGGTASQRAFASMAISRVSGIYPAAASAMYRDCIVTLFGSLNGVGHAPREQNLFRRMAEHLSPAHTASGVSRLFADLSELRGYFFQAYTTARLARGGCEFFDDVFPAPIFEAAVMGAGCGMLLHPALRQLHEYDQRNQTEYFRTLQVYSLTLHDKEAAARILCVHRNTLVYRLNRISELFGLPYEEPRTALAILNSYQLYAVGVLRRADFGLPENTAAP